MAARTLKANLLIDEGALHTTLDRGMTHPGFQGEASPLGRDPLPALQQSRVVPKEGLEPSSP